MKLTGAISPRVQNKFWDKMAFGVILLFAFLSLFAPFLANENPIYINDGKAGYWPAVSHVNWRKLCANNDCKKINALISFSPETIDVTAINAGPMSPRKTLEKGRHLLGADQLGRDVLSALIYGSRTALWVSMLAALLACFTGLIYGLSAGYYGNDRIRYSWPKLLFLLIGVVLIVTIGVFISFALQALMISKTLAVILYLLLFVIFLLMTKVEFKSASKNKFLDVDSFAMRLVDLVKALPPLFIVLFVLQIKEADTMWYMICLIAFLLWASFARHSRAELLRLRNSSAVQSALLSGRSDFWIWRNCIIPFAIRPLLVVVAFSMASAILLEATLSFLGLGLPAEHVSWGTLINAARTNSTSWWLLVFPGLSMLSLIWALQHLGRMFEQKLRKRQRMRSV